MMKEILITADDYGMCPEVDEAIEKMALARRITTTNVLMNFRTDFSNTKLKDINDFSIGIHWNVTTGRPVSDVTTIKTLVNENGEFYPIDIFRYRYKRNMISPKELEIELTNQYNLFYSVFGQPDYWNSHENSALYPKEYKVFKKVALEKGIIGTRNFQRVYVDYDLAKGFSRKMREFIVRFYVNIYFGLHIKRKFVIPDGRIVTFVNHSKTEFERMQKCLARCKKKTVEIIIHPATESGNPLFGNIGDDRVLEYQKYSSDEFYGLFANSSSRVISYKDLFKRNN